MNSRTFVRSLGSRIYVRRLGVISPTCASTNGQTDLGLGYVSNTACRPGPTPLTEVMKKPEERGRRTNSHRRDGICICSAIPSRDSSMSLEQKKREKRKKSLVAMETLRGICPTYSTPYNTIRTELSSSGNFSSR